MPAPHMWPTPSSVMSKVLRQRRSSPIDRKSTRASRSKVIAMIAARIVKSTNSHFRPRVDSRPPSEDQSIFCHCIDRSRKGEEGANLQDVLQDDVPSDDEGPDLATTDKTKGSKKKEMKLKIKLC
ncbi:hypothetical protein PMAYCL1PPCAC_05586 [Pristionchus mayeri]|uniref:Uncharacterized protein n=1 Tax=Pristionchus mayeri TaxID=1317129 RepID=A0AAN5CBQ1_9BILA|nr:hypothetical protein PMAYCL1PPCAC_05586 [Pristionchus mayeri]